MLMLGIHQNDWMSLDLEERMNIAWVHMHIKEWNKKRAAELPAVIKECEKSLREEGFSECYAAVLKNDTTLRKFLIMIGFVPHIDASHLVPTMEVWKRKL